MQKDQSTTSASTVELSTRATDATTSETTASDTFSNSVKPNKTQKSCKSHKLLCIFGAVIGTIVLVGASVVTTYLVMSNQQSNSANVEIAPAEITVVTEEGESVTMTNYDAIAQLDGRMDVFDKVTSLGYYSYLSEIYDGQPSQDAKLYFTLSSLVDEFSPVNASEATSLAETYLNSDWADAVKDVVNDPNQNHLVSKISLALVSARYHDLFGEKLKSESIENASMIGNCGGYTYLANDQLFVKGFAINCGGVAPYIDTYRYNYEVSDNNAYVDVATGMVFSSSIDDSGVCTTEQVLAYGLVPSNQPEGDYGDINYDCVSGIDSGAMVNSYNYQDFAHYRFEFTRDNGSYYFTGVTKL